MNPKYPVIDGKKICSDCLDNKDVDDFYKGTTGNPRGKCKSCFSEESKEFKKIYRSKPENQIKIKEYRDLHGGLSPEERRKYYEENHEKVRATINKWKRKRYTEDINYNIEHRYRSRLQSVTRGVGYRKQERTLSYLGCTNNEFTNHLESLFLEGMTWNNRDSWDIDHKIPCCAFDLTDEEQLKECFNYKNLQPLWKQDNKHKIKTDIEWKKLKHSQKTNAEKAEAA